MAPMVLAVVLEIIDFAQAHDSRTPWTKRAWKIMSHFPGIQLKQHWDFLQELSIAANHMMNLAEFKTQILDVINCFNPGECKLMFSCLEWKYKTL